MMRKGTASSVLLALALVAGSTIAMPAQAADTVIPFVPRKCEGQPGDEYFRRPASCQRILYTYGPLHVTPGDNLILVGPVTIEKPMIDGHIVRFKPDLIRADLSVPPIEELHLHHAVWFAPTEFQLDPLFASGEEKTAVRIPDGYGIPVHPYSVWLLNYMLHNQLVTPENVFITYELDIIPSSDPTPIKNVVPKWYDVASYNAFNPIYNTQRGFGTNGECAFPKQKCANIDPYGETHTGQGSPGNGVGLTQGTPSGTIVWMQGHVHPGGLRLETSIRRGGVTKPVFTSNMRYYDPGGPLSWDMSAEVTPPDFRLRVNSGDTLITNSVYETSQASWYEGMGIVITFYAPGDTSGVDPFQTTVDPTVGVVTHGHMAEASNHGGVGETAPFTTLPTINTNSVSIAGFTYAPGNGPGGLAPIPSVPRGQPLTFNNLDAGAMIFHTITECRNPCNGSTGISYPLANGDVDFDSFELGYGIPSATAASNRSSYTLNTASMDPAIYTYFCRVHPFMRGAFQVR